MKKQTIITACTFAAMTMATPAVFAVQPAMSNHVCASDAIKKDNRPVESKRLFCSKAVEEQIQRIQQLLKNQKLSWMFTNCFPNTLDTTVHFRKDKKDGKPDTFVYTGDIHAMWLRDSGAQVWPYVALANKDEKLKKMLKGVILRQLKCINIDPYANAFNKEPQPEGGWMNDITDMKPELHERKYEIDSLCYPIRLAYHYWQTTGDASVFDAEWQKAVKNVLPALANEMVTMVKESSICSVLGMAELMFAAKTIAGSTGISLAPYTLAALVYFCINYPASKGIEAIERRMRRGDKQ